MDSCGVSIYDPDKSERVIVECEIVVTAMASEKLQELGSEGEKYLYIKVKGGGCSGYIYEMDLLEDKPTEQHQVIETEDMIVVVHDLDSGLLSGIEIDYEDKLMGGGFTIKNPNATRSCGCGLSFK